MKTAPMLAGVALAVCCGCGESGPSVTRARLMISHIDKAVDAYKARHGGHAPDELKILTENQNSGLTANDLVDPWGRPYHYDPGECHPDTQQPRVWSEGPNPGEPGSIIANWTVKEGGEP
jgi:Type II secretion system (T2SS), protein G